MKTSSPRRAAFLFLSLVLAASCGTAAREPVPASPGVAGEARGPAPPQADVRFIQGMIPHHAQALEMTSLVSERTDDEAIRLLAERIEVSQQDEIAMMRRWLESHGIEAPDPQAHGRHHEAMHHPLMPGMLTPEEMERLARARGAEFDRLFLESMIRHHEGALVMVDELFASGGGQESDMYQIASEIASDQRIEIERMRRMLAR